MSQRRPDPDCLLCDIGPHGGAHEYRIERAPELSPAVRRAAITEAVDRMTDAECDALSLELVCEPPAYIRFALRRALTGEGA